MLGAFDDWRQTDGGMLAFAVARAVAIFVIGLVVAKSSRRLVDRFGTRLTAQHRMIMGRGTLYAILTLAIVAALREVGFDLSVLLGAAGILTVAIGFAAQTSMSNVISGLFLIGERPFVLGDIVRIGQTTGEVVEIGLVSVHIRTFDNVRVRLPNEQLFKSEIANFSQYPIRRIDVALRIGHGEDLTRVRRVLLGAAQAIPTVLDEPKPAVILRGFTDDGVDVLFTVWSLRDLMPDVQNAIFESVHRRLVEEGIRMPAPHRTLHDRAAASGRPVEGALGVPEPGVTDPKKP
jgi:small-conductance mechanosensitive channel